MFFIWSEQYCIYDIQYLKSEHTAYLEFGANFRVTSGKGNCNDDHNKSSEHKDSSVSMDESILPSATTAFSESFIDYLIFIMLFVGNHVHFISSYAFPGSIC